MSHKIVNLEGFVDVTTKLLTFFQIFLFVSTSQKMKFSIKKFFSKEIHSPLVLVFNPFWASAAFHIETNNLLYCENQLTVFYMKCNTDQIGYNSFMLETLSFPTI